MNKSGTKFLRMIVSKKYLSVSSSFFFKFVRIDLTIISCKDSVLLPIHRG